MMADASSSSVGKLPTPDYINAAEDDLTLRVPTVIDYDKWRSTASAPESLPLPPAHLLAADDNEEAFPEPPPDYDSEMTEDRQYPGLIPPHKLPNPVLDSQERVRLNKDIKFNVKHGIDVLNKKPELTKELERRKVDRQKKDQAEQLRKNRNSFEQKMDVQKEKLNSSQVDADKIIEEGSQSELSRIHNKIKSKAKDTQ